MFVASEWLASHASTIIEALLHSLWISTSIGLMVWLALCNLPVRYGTFRYALALSGLLLTVVGTFAAASSVDRVRAIAAESANSMSRSQNQQAPALERRRGPGSEDGADSNGHEQGRSMLAADLQNGKSNHEVHSTSPPLPVAAQLNSLEASDGDRSRAGRATDRDALVISAAFNWSRASVWLMIAWLFGVVLMLLRTLNSLLGMRSIRSGLMKGGVSCLTELQVIADRLCEQLKLRQMVRLVVSDTTPSPAVLGFFRPVVLIPPAMLTGIPVEHWELIIAHELAHVRRYDAIVNLMQMLIESILFFNPAVWWISRQVRIEREVCCDAMAASVTGQSIEFARMLLNVASGSWRTESGHSAPVTSAATAASQNHHTPVLALSFADNTDPGALKDRVTRLADPDRTSAPRFTRVGLFVALAALIGTAVAIQQGTDFAVQKVADLMTPAERVETLARLQAENTGVYVPQGAAASELADDEPVETRRNTGEETDFQQALFDVKVVINTEDGTPVPKELSINRKYVIRKPGGSTDSTGDNLPGPSEPIDVYETTMQLPRCQFVLGGSAPGFAPFAIAPRSLFEQSDALPVQITLTRGFSGTIRIVDEAGLPVPDASVTGGAVIRLSGGTSGSNFIRETTDADGYIQLSHCGSGIYHLVGRATGFQHESWEISLTAEQPAHLVMKAARPTILNVVDDQTGLPVKGAVCVQQLYEDHGVGHQTTYTSSDPRRSDRRHWLVLGESDAEGRLVINQLRDEATYTVAVLADGFGTQGIAQLTAGQSDQTIRLRSPVIVSGKIVGDLSQLRKKYKSESEFILQYENPLEGDSDNHADLLSTTVKADGSFSISDVVPGCVEFRLPNMSGRQKVAVTQSIDDLVLSLPEPEPETASAQTNVSVRDVILHLKGTTANAPARGYLQVSWNGTDPSLMQSGLSMPLEDNQVKLSVPIGVSLRYEPQGMVGYFVDYKGKTKDIVAGVGPQIIDVDAEPAGAVHGELLDASGQPANAGFVNVYPASVSWFTKWKKDGRRLNPSSASGNSAFFQSLPFGGTYVVFARMTNDDGLQWCVSEPFTIDGANPIQPLKLQLKPGRPVSVQLNGSDGMPVKAAEVTLSISLKCAGTDASSGFSITRNTDDNGLAHFAHALPDDLAGPLTIHGSVQVNDVPGHVGQNAALDELTQQNGVYQIQLDPAVTARGILIDAASGRPVPNAKIRVYPLDFAAAKFKGNTHTVSDAKGEFEFASLEPLEYQGHVEGAAIKGTKITLMPNEGYRLQPPASFQSVQSYLSITGGVKVPVRWEVELIPGQGLVPLP